METVDNVEVELPGSSVLRWEVILDITEMILIGGVVDVRCHGESR